MAEYPRQRKTEPWELMIIKLLIAQPLPDGFIKLSQELRDRIYAPLFATGDTTLACVSKAMYDDTQKALSAHGIYRIRIDRQQLQQCARRHHELFQLQFTDGALASIRNLDLLVAPTLGLGFGGWDSGYSISSEDILRVLPSLLDLMECPMHCQVRLEVPRDDVVRAEQVEGLGLLRVFQTVAVKLCYGPARQVGGTLLDALAADPEHFNAAVKAVESALGSTGGDRNGRPRLEITWSGEEVGRKVFERPSRRDMSGYRSAGMAYLD